MICRRLLRKSPSETENGTLSNWFNLISVLFEVERLLGFCSARVSNSLVDFFVFLFSESAITTTLCFSGGFLSMMVLGYH